jgi:metallophosphoesterase superfamily enzyme
VLAGHVHPAYRLFGKGRQRLRLPCFYVQAQVSLLPAFGAFTGGMNIERGEKSKVYVVGDGAVWETL